MKRVYLICPVRNVSPEDVVKLDEYVRKLEEDWDCKVHYPPRDCDQSGTGIEICNTHLEAMRKCDEVHVLWDPNSKGSHFDFGMAFALEFPIVLVSPPEQMSHKSYADVLLAIAQKAQSK